MADYVEFFLNSSRAIVQLDLIEISHPSFTTTYRKVRNAVEGVTVTLETSEVQRFDYYPMKIESIGMRENLDFGLKIDLGDLGELLPTELDAVSSTDAFSIKPTIIYRTYRSDDLSSPMFGPLTLEATSFTFNGLASAFEAKAPSLNINKTGELYTYERFPMLRAFL